MCILQYSSCGKLNWNRFHSSYSVSSSSINFFLPLGFYLWFLIIMSLFFTFLFLEVVSLITFKKQRTSLMKKIQDLEVILIMLNVPRMLLFIFFSFFISRYKNNFILCIFFFLSLILWMSMIRFWLLVLPRG